MQDRMRDRTFTSRATAYLKAQDMDDSDTVVELSYDDSPVLRPLVVPLLVSYVVDAGDRYELVQNRHLKDEGIDEQALHRIGLANLAQLVNERPPQVHPYGHIFAVVMGGDFEASLLLLDSLWEKRFRQFVHGDYAVAVPARDILAFCDASSTEGLHELREVIQRVFATGEHVLSSRLYVRHQGRWERMSN